MRSGHFGCLIHIRPICSSSSSGWCRWYDVIPYQQESFKLISSRQSRLLPRFNEDRPSCFSLHHLASGDGEQRSPVWTVLWSLHRRWRSLPWMLSILTPKSPAKKSTRRKKAFQQRLLNREQSGMTESHIQGKFSLWQKPILISAQADAVTGFGLVRFISQIGDFPLWNSDGCPRARRVCEMSFRKKKILFLLLIFPCQKIQICLLMAAGLFKAPLQQPWCPCCSGTATQKKHYHHFHWYKKTLMMVMKCVFIRRRERTRERSSRHTLWACLLSLFCRCHSFHLVTLPVCVFLESKFGWKEFQIRLVYLKYAYVTPPFRFLSLCCYFIPIWGHSVG